MQFRLRLDAEHNTKLSTNAATQGHRLRHLFGVCYLLYAPLIEGINVPHETLHGCPVLVNGEKLPTCVRS
jgi:hypothetical protein